MDLGLALSIFCNGEHFIRERREMAQDQYYISTSGTTGRKTLTKHPNEHERAAAADDRQPIRRRPEVQPSPTGEQGVPPPEIEGPHFFEATMFR